KREYASAERQPCALRKGGGPAAMVVHRLASVMVEQAVGPQPISPPLIPVTTGIYREIHRAAGAPKRPLGQSVRSDQGRARVPVIMGLADVLQSATGRRWIQRSSTPIEFSPLHDAPPFPREMISIEPFAPELGLREAVTTFGNMMEPVMWAGKIQAQLLQGGVDRALVEVTGNPLTGPLLLALRILQAGGQSLLFIHEVRGEVQSAERAS